MVLLEICAANLKSALAANTAGAHRIELCSGLDGGGVTPSPGLTEQAVYHLSVPVCVLIRPREGDFCFSGDEIELMLRDIVFCRKAGAAGVVVGALNADYSIDENAMRAFKAAAGPMEVVCHRAFDFVQSPEEALETLIRLGFCRVLTSGQAATAWEGRESIRRCVVQARNRIDIMPGGGLTPEILGGLKAVTGATHFHTTAKKWVRQPGQNDIPGLANGYFASDVDQIKACLAALTGH